MAQQISQSFYANYVNSGPKALEINLLKVYNLYEEKDFCRAIKLPYWPLF